MPLKDQPIALFLTCANKKQADKITSGLLSNKLAVCIKQTPVFSSFLWKGNVDNAEEIMLIMESTKSKFESIEKEIKKWHSYEIFVLFSVPITQTTAGVEKWIRDELQ